MRGDSDGLHNSERGIVGDLGNDALVTRPNLGGNLVRDHVAHSVCRSCHGNGGITAKTAETNSYETRASVLSAKRFLRYAEPSTKRPQDDTHRTRTAMHRNPKRLLEVIFRDGPLDREHVQHQRLHPA